MNAGLHSGQRNRFRPPASFRCIRAISADISPDPATDQIGDPANQPARISPSFLIRSGGGPAAAGASLAWAGPSLRLDRINSSEVLRLARQIYFQFLSSCPGAIEPAGIVLDATGAGGRVVFEPPVLLPEEQFVPIDWLRNRGSGRARPNRPGPSRSSL